MGDRLQRWERLHLRASDRMESTRRVANRRPSEACVRHRVGHEGGDARYLSRKTTEDYARLFARLNRAGSRTLWDEATLYKAPQKPILLLAVMDLIELNEISSNLIKATDDLVEMFERYWERAVPFKSPSTLAMPFVRLASEGFWHLSLVVGREQELDYAEKSVRRLRECVNGAYLDDDLYDLIQIEANREFLRSVLTGTYFTSKVGKDVAQQSLINRKAFSYSEELLKHPKDPEVREALSIEEEYRPAVRDQGFRRAVIAAYSHRCTLCGIRVRTRDGYTLAEAAHIRAWSKSYDDRPINGLALCRTCHWTFDRGLMSITGRYEVLASNQLSVHDNLPGYLTSLEGRSIVLPSQESYYPDHECLGWHRANIFRRD